MNKTTIVFICSMMSVAPSAYAGGTYGDNNSAAPSQNSTAPSSDEMSQKMQWCKDNPQACQSKREERRKWCKDNPAQCKAKREKWCQDNPEKCKEKTQKWCEHHPEMCNMIREEK
jgi:hypothetical protein